MNEVSDISLIKGFIESYSLALTALAFIVYTVCVRKITSFNLVILGLIILHMTHAHITRLLIPLFGIEAYHSTLSYVWYLSFGLTDVIFIVVCRKIAGRYELTKDRISDAVLIVIAFMASLQFIDLALTRFGFNFFAEIYSSGVVLGNIVNTLLPCIMVLRIILVCSGVVNLTKARP